MKKIIDEKGKLFGLINIVDLMVAIVILAIISVVAIRVFSPTKNAPGTSVVNGKQEAYVTLYVQNAVPESLETLKVGDKLVANNNFTTAEIVSIDSKPADLVTTDAEGNSHVVSHPLWLDLIVVVKDEVNASNPILKIGGQEARVNLPLILKTQQFEANSKVRSIELVDEEGNAIEIKENENE
ncbi:MAG: DUF4330 domain-containing protein [Eubacteriales bacterium]|nr:DUF4330 domain-containing protein [Eubacteriales bacterium]